MQQTDIKTEALKGVHVYMAMVYQGAVQHTPGVSSAPIRTGTGERDLGVVHRISTQCVVRAPAGISIDFVQ